MGLTDRFRRGDSDRLNLYILGAMAEEDGLPGHDLADEPGNPHEPVGFHANYGHALGEPHLNIMDVCMLGNGGHIRSAHSMFVEERDDRRNHDRDWKGSMLEQYDEIMDRLDIPHHLPDDDTPRGNEFHETTSLDELDEDQAIQEIDLTYGTLYPLEDNPTFGDAFDDDETVIEVGITDMEDDDHYIALVSGDDEKDRLAPEHVIDHVQEHHRELFETLDDWDRYDEDDIRWTRADWYTKEHTWERLDEDTRLRRISFDKGEYYTFNTQTVDDVFDDGEPIHHTGIIDLDGDDYHEILYTGDEDRIEFDPPHRMMKERAIQQMRRSKVREAKERIYGS